MTTRTARAVSPGPFPPTARKARPLAVAMALGVVTLLGLAQAGLGQEEPTAAGQEIVVPTHWSPYAAPSSYPEGTQIHIIERGDTLWDLSNQYLENPFLWPQLWDANRYIENPHLIYPGDPVRIPELDVVRPEGVEPGAPGAPGAPGVEGTEAMGPGGVPGAPGAGPQGPQFYPAYEEVSIQCAPYYIDGEDDDFRIFGSEEGEVKDNLATNDIVYLNRGTRDGINPGDQYYTQRRVKGHAFDNNFVLRTGWLTVLAVQERTAMAEITQACASVRIGDYLKPFEPIPVPLLPFQPAATRLTPESGRMRGRILGSFEDQVTLGEGNLVSIDVGERDGVVPGNLFTIFRYVYDDAPRKVLGELAVLTVQERNATARIIESYDYIDVGDLVELK